MIATQLQQLIIKSRAADYGSEPFTEIRIKDSKALKSLHPDFMHKYFQNGSHSARRKSELAVNRAKSFDCDTTASLTKFGGLSN